MFMTWWCSYNHYQRSCTLEFDGASKGNPGQAGAGVIIRADDGSLVLYSSLLLFFGVEFYPICFPLLHMYLTFPICRAVGYVRV